MSLSEVIEKNQKIVLPAAVVLLLGALLLIFTNRGGGAEGLLSQPKWMYDLNEKVLVRGGADMLAPVDRNGATFDYGRAGTGGTLVDAVVMTCGDATAINEGMTQEQIVAAGGRISHVKRELPGSQDAGSEAAPRFDNAPESGLVASLSNLEEWVPVLSPKGIAIMTAGMASCPDGSFPARTIPH